MKKTLRSILALALSLVIACGCCSVAFAATKETSP